jgi:hypothetical protein
VPGPTPKPAATRQRRNRTTSSATLTADHKVRAPALPKGNPWCSTHGRRKSDCLLDPRISELRPCRTEQWHPMTKAWWKDIWASPMAPEFLKADTHGLFTLAMLEDDFWRSTSVKERRELVAEIRLQRQCFGLSPIDRRRLQWEVERAEQATAKRKPPARKPVADTPAPADPRLLLIPGGKAKTA